MTSEDNNTSSKSKSLLFYYPRTLVLKKSFTISSIKILNHNYWVLIYFFCCILNDSLAKLERHERKNVIPLDRPANLRWSIWLVEHQKTHYNRHYLCKIVVEVHCQNVIFSLRPCRQQHQPSRERLIEYHKPSRSSPLVNHLRLRNT